MIHFKKKGWQLKPFYKKKKKRKKKEKRNNIFLEVCLPKLLLFGNLGFMVLARELAPLNPFNMRKGMWKIKQTQG